MRKVCILRMQKASVHIISTYSFATCSQNPTHHIDQNLSAQGWCIFGETGTSMTWALYSISFPHLAEAEASIFHLPIVPKCSRPSPTTVCSTKSHGISTSEHSLLSRCFCLNLFPELSAHTCIQLAKQRKLLSWTHLYQEEKKVLFRSICSDTVCQGNPAWECTHLCSETNRTGTCND